MCSRLLTQNTLDADLLKRNRRGQPIKKMLRPRGKFGDFGAVVATALESGSEMD